MDVLQSFETKKISNFAVQITFRSMIHGKSRLSTYHTAESEDFPRIILGKWTWGILSFSGPKGKVWWKTEVKNLVTLSLYILFWNIKITWLNSFASATLITRDQTFRVSYCGKWRLSAVCYVESLHFPRVICENWIEICQ